jgi:hypothetical protein
MPVPTVVIPVGSVATAPHPLRHRQLIADFRQLQDAQQHGPPASARMRRSPVLIYNEVQSSSSSPSPLSQHSSSSIIHSNSTAASSPSPYSDIQSFIHSYTDSCGLYSDSLAVSRSYTSSTTLGDSPLAASNNSYTSSCGLYGDRLPSPISSYLIDKKKKEVEDARRRSVRVSPIKSQDSGYSDSEEGGSGGGFGGGSVGGGGGGGVGGGQSQEFVSRVFVAASASHNITAAAAVLQRMENTFAGEEAAGGGVHSEDFNIIQTSSPKLSRPAGKAKTCRKCLQMARKQEKQNRKRRSNNLTEEAGEENQPPQEESQRIQVAKGDPSGLGLSRCPVTHWMSELPSLYEPECTNMLQSKAILAEVSSLSSLVMDNLRRVQSQGLEVTRLFAAICR